MKKGTKVRITGTSWAGAAGRVEEFDPKRRIKAPAGQKKYRPSVLVDFTPEKLRIRRSYWFDVDDVEEVEEVHDERQP